MTRFQTLYTFESGANGSRIVFLPGLGATTRYWQGRLSTLEQSHRVLLVDPLGFGQSPKPWSRYTVDCHIAALRNTLGQQPPFTLVGHSMGTLLAIAYAARYPEQVERLILFSTPYFGGLEQAKHYWGSQSALYRLVLTNMLLAAVACIVTRRVLGWAMPYLRRDIPHEIAADIVKHTWRSFTSSLWEVIYNYDVIKDVDALDARIAVFCLHGDQDRAAPLAGLLTLAGQRRNWRIRVLPGVDHHPLLRTPDVCLQTIKAALAQEALPV
jgi:pimeloyl-ACP methyl ester carboxylesterase